MEVDGDLKTLIGELSAAQAVESDLQFAYELQMQEALTASFSQNGDAGVADSSNLNPTLSLEAASGTTISTAQLLAEEIAHYEQQLLDHQVATDEMKKIRIDLSRRVHDHAFAREILDVPEEQWKQVGDYIEKPYNEGSGGGNGVNNNQDSFRVYVKGIMSGAAVEVGVEKRNTFVGGIGVAICDMNEEMIFEVSKGVSGVEMSGEVVEVKALIEGLHFATIFGLKRVLIVSDSNLLYQCVTGKWHPRQSNVAPLVDQVTVLQRNFARCNLSLVAQKDVEFAFKLAQDAICSLGRLPLENNCGKKVVETCSICLEDINTNRMFSIDGCLHRYCFSCIRRHVEVALLQRKLPKCPHQGCNSQLKKDDCKMFLTLELFDIMSELIMEASVPPTDRIYCPYPNCSALMSRSEYVSGVMTILCIKCRKCHRPFCMNCRVPWHDNMTCSVYKQKYPLMCPEDAKLKHLATQSLWRQCGNCNHMVSLAEGCNHIYCRCGHEFCYVCGAPWKNKKATCACPLWDERKIIHLGRNRP